MIVYGALMNKANFKKKVYRRLNASPLSESISLSEMPIPDAPRKIIPTTATQGMQDTFKKTFLPLLIEVFELRQWVSSYKTKIGSTLSSSTDPIYKSPKEILSQLEQLQEDMKESQRWCEGVTLQIAKGIKEVKLTLRETEGGFFKRFLRRIKKWI